MITAIAIDDELPALKLIENFCNKVEFINLDKTFNKPVEALKYLKNFPVDLLFLDINMPSLTGIELFKSVNQKTMVIFTTAYSDYAVEGFNLQAIDYLLKPFSFERFMQAVNKARDYYYHTHDHETEENHIFLRADYSLIKIKISDIVFIEGLDDYLKLHLNNQKPFIARLTMKVIHQKLPADQFIRVHRSYIISKNYIEQIRNKIITMQGFEIPISSSYENDFNKSLNS